jgi:hypothetical protein
VEAKTILLEWIKYMSKEWILSTALTIGVVLI